jgi:ubiquinone/menaquinone biosynthesis C-methylase UbiE
MIDQRQEYFDGLASDWDSGFSAEHLERISQVIDSMGIKPGSRVLDLGCGTGVLFGYVSRKVGKSGSIVGVDFSVQMALTARRNFPKENIHAIVAEASALPFGRGTFDVAIAFQSFPHFADKDKAMREAHRVLKPGSGMWIVHLLSSEQLAEHHGHHNDVVSGDVLPCRDEMSRLLTENGFCGVTIEDRPHFYCATAVAK